LNSNHSLSEIDLKDILTSYTKHWKWFALSVFFTLLLAFLYIRYSVPEYAASAKIQILEDQSTTSELSVFKELDIFSGGSKKVEDEIQIINSRSNLVEVIRQLGLNIKIESVGNIKSTEIYKNDPFKLNFFEPDSTINNSNLEFWISLSSDTTFGYTEEEGKPMQVYAYGKTISTAIGDLVITPNSQNFTNSQKDKKYKVSISPIIALAQQYQKKIVVVAAAEGSNILNISLNDPILRKAKDILNTLIITYNKNAIADKKIIADRTSNFIDDRITDIYSDLSSVDQSAQEFKTGRGITDIASEANVNLNVGVANQQELQNATVQLNIAASMRDIVEDQDTYDVLPSNVGLTDGSIVNTTARYNEWVSERKRLLKGANEKNPIIQNLDQQLDGLRQNLQSSLTGMINNLSMQVNNLSSQQSRFNSKLYAAPKNERALRDITRQQQTTESLYLYLLQKREEAQISLASSAPKSKIIDGAYGSQNIPVSPKKPIVFLAAFIFGLFIPFSIIYANDLLDNKIHNKHGLEKLVTDNPVLGEIPKLNKKDDKIIVKEDRSVMAESLRILRTNLDYLIKTKESKTGKNNVVFVTSSVSGEGKTFLSTNLSMILASTHKKVLLIGADIRNPKLYSFFTSKEVNNLIKPNKNKDNGFTEFLFDDSLQVKDIINPMLVHSNVIDVIYSGKIPPNPSELLLSKRLKLLFEEVSEAYDYVIVDTAPLMVVTDTLLISEYANHMIYVTRAGVTENKAIHYPLKLKEEGKIKGLSFVVNDVKVSNLGYGGKYGYGYSKTMKKWWKF
jgi:tyrosine-protein kinase Etk/Wzc